MKHYDAIVIGCGGLGSAALYWLSRELGSSVLGIEQFGLGHERGASQDQERAIFQKDTGLVDARKSSAVHVALARARGARVLENAPVSALRPDGEGVEVVTDEQAYHADRVVVASDMWTNEVLRETGFRLPLTVTQEQVTYYATPNLREFAPDRFPVFMWHGRDNFYGFPVYGEVATKLGQHMGGHEVTAETRTFDPDPIRQERYRHFLERHLPGFLGPELRTKTCPYTLPPDHHFVLDTLPDHRQILVVVGAGQAFKFASLIGRILAGPAMDGSSAYPIEPFKITRPAITDRTFERRVLRGQSRRTGRGEARGRGPDHGRRPRDALALPLRGQAAPMRTRSLPYRDRSVAIKESA